MNTELKQRILDTLNEHIYNLRQDKVRGIECTSPAGHLAYDTLCSNLIDEAIKTRDEFVAFCG